MISMSGKAIRKWWWLFALPTFAAFVVGFLVPFIMGVYLSFRKFTTVTDGKFVGFRNYYRALKDPHLVYSFLFTTLFAVITTIIINVIAFAIAYMLTKKFKGTTIFRAVFFMPNLIGGIVLSYIWQLLLNGILGYFNRTITFSEVFGFWGLVIVVCWQQIGYMMITVCTFLTITNGFKLFDQNFALTNGGPSRKTEMLALNIYRTFTTPRCEGVGQAQAVMFFIVVAVIAMVQNMLTRSKEVAA